MKPGHNQLKYPTVAKKFKQINKTPTIKPLSWCKVIQSPSCKGKSVAAMQHESYLPFGGKRKEE